MTNRNFLNRYKLEIRGYLKSIHFFCDMDIFFIERVMI